MSAAEELFPIQVSRAEWDTVRSILQVRVPDRDVWAFGSRANGRAKPYSDLDLGLCGSEALSLPCLAVLAEDFEESDLPFRVDLIDLGNAEPAFADRVRRAGVLIQRHR